MSRVYCLSWGLFRGMLRFYEGDVRYRHIISGEFDVTLFGVKIHSSCASSVWDIPEI